jgi:hypothetical protein
LLWLSAQFDRHTTGGYWAAYGVVAAAGLVLAASQLRGGGGNPPAMFVLAFVPVLIAAGWVIVAQQPHPNWARGHVLSWSGDIGIRDVMHDVATWLGVLAFGIGYVFGATFELPTVLIRRREPATAPTTAWRPTPAARYSRREAAADEPVARERAAAGDRQVVGPGPIRERSTD